MGLQVSHCVYTEATQEESIWGTAAASWGDFSRVSVAQGVKDCGRAHDGGSRSYVLEHSAEVCSFKCCGIFKREECDPDCAEVWGTTEELHRRALLGSGIFALTVGLDENIVRAYISNQEEEDERYDQMKLIIG
jgi:hypothetical protein